MKYGDVLYLRTWGRRWCYPSVYYPFCYRKDPVPGIFKKRYHFKDWYKAPKTTQEKRKSFEYPDFVRGKRKAHQLPNAYDDWQRSDVRYRKAWKNKKIRKQWMKNR